MALYCLRTPFRDEPQVYHLLPHAFIREQLLMLFHEFIKFGPGLKNLFKVPGEHRQRGIINDNVYRHNRERYPRDSADGRVLVAYGQEHRHDDKKDYYDYVNDE